MKELVLKHKAVLLFVLKFSIIYLIGNTMYGLWIETYANVPDPITILISNHTSIILRLFNSDLLVQSSNIEPKVHFISNNDVIISVFEGCNGINVSIVFIAFVIAYGGKLLRTIWFIAIGLIGIYFINLLRIALLFYVAKHLPDLMYYTHKYIFTGIIYLFIFTLWYLWIKLNEK